VIIIKINLYYKDKDFDFLFECGLTPVIKRKKTKYLTSKNLDVKSIRNLVFDKDHRNEAILKQKNLYNQLLNSNEELDLEECGKYIQRLKRIVVNEEYNIVSNYKMIKKLTLPDDNIKEKPYNITRANINIPDNPLIILNKKWISKDLLFKNYIFDRNYFIKHLSREQFDSLHELAIKLNDSNQMAEIIAYSKEEAKRTPIILRSKGKNYPKAYLEGRVKNDQFALILHLSNREFIISPKKPIETEKEIEIEIVKIERKEIEENLFDKLNELIKTINTTPFIEMKIEKDEGLEKELEKAFEKETGKKAIWHGQETKAYTQWQKEKMEEIEQVFVKEKERLVEKDLFTELNELIKNIEETPFKSIEISEEKEKIDLKQKIVIAKKIFK